MTEAAYRPGKLDVHWSTGECLPALAEVGALGKAINAQVKTALCVAIRRLRDDEVNNDLLRAFSWSEVEASSIADLPLGPSELAETIALVRDGTITKKGARLVLEELTLGGGSPAAIVEQRGLRQVQDVAQIEEWCRAALAGQERLIAEVKAGNDKALGAAIGPVMKASGGSANPGLVRETLARLIREEL